MDTVRICETCGVCTIVDAICTCGDVIDPNAGDYGCIDGIWFCEICI